MSLSIGIIGLPNVGKSTLFNALTNNSILAANYPFATIEPNTGIVPIPDERLDTLAAIYNSKKVIPATVTFVDIAGLVAGASKGEGLGNQFLANIRSCNAIAHVVRAFRDDNVQHVDTAPSPQKDIETIETELVLADLQTCRKRLPALEKESSANPRLRPQVVALKRTIKLLDGGTPLFRANDELDAEQKAWLQKELQLLTLKPILYVFNIDEEQLGDTAHQAKLTKLVEPNQSIFICAKLEHELQSLSPTEKTEMLETYGVKRSGLASLVQAAYQALGLQSYLTAGEKETRAWTIASGATAPQAAGVIHGDFEKGFIAAQVINYRDLISAGSEQAAKAAGKVRTEGKDYIMQPDDVVEFRFNV